MESVSGDYYNAFMVTERSVLAGGAGAACVCFMGNMALSCLRQKTKNTRVLLAIDWRPCV